MNKRYSESENMLKISNYFGLSFVIFVILTLALIITLGKDNDLPFLTSLIGLLSFVVFVVTKIKTIRKFKEEFIEESKAKFEKLGLNTDEFSFSIHTNNAFKLDELNSEMIYVYRENNESDYNKKYIPFNKILDVTINSNGMSLISTSTGELIGKSLVGGVLAGGFGSVIGALGTSKTSTESIRNMSINITVDDLNDPIISFEVINSPNGIDKNSDIYKQTISKVDELFGKFTVIMKRNEKLNNIS